MVDEAKPTSIEVPMAAWVRGGGTSTSGDDLATQKRHADAVERRDKQDAMYAQSRQGQGRVDSMKLGGTESHPSIVLWLKRPKEDEPQHFMLCELSAQEGDGVGETELVLMMQCARCITRKQVHPEEANFHIRQSNRMFSFDERTPKWLKDKFKGRLWINPDDTNETVLVAGTVTMHERAKCPACGWTFVIDDSIVHTEN